MLSLQHGHSWILARWGASQAMVTHPRFAIRVEWRRRDHRVITVFARSFVDSLDFVSIIVCLPHYSTTYPKQIDPDMHRLLLLC